VSWTGGAPQRTLPAGAGPLVAVLDTGAGRHPWLGADVVTRHPEVLGTVIGLGPGPAHEHTSGTGDHMVGELRSDSGHGTFIAGLVHQACPDAHIIDVRLFGDSGVVTESELLRSLQLLALRQVLAVHGLDPEVAPVDVLTMSLGYYHEQPEDPDFDALLDGPLALLGRYGVAVVVSSGNDASSRPIFPAAFAPHPGGQVADSPDRIPVTAVGALNPDSTIALFSNDGPWVRFLRPGACLVSTMPTTYDASMEPVNQVRNSRGEWRTSLDPDDFSSGFGVWSGTSFAAPVFAGQLARALADGPAPADLPARIARVRDLLETMPGRRADLTEQAP
jgi:subtilisin family serine protease